MSENIKSTLKNFIFNKYIVTFVYKFGYRKKKIVAEISRFFGIIIQMFGSDHPLK